MRNQTSQRAIAGDFSKQEEPDLHRGFVLLQNRAIYLTKSTPIHIKIIGLIPDSGCGNDYQDIVLGRLTSAVINSP